MARRQCMAAVVLVAMTATGCATAAQRYVSFPAQGQNAAQQQYDSEECELIAQGKKKNPLIAGLAGGVTHGLVSGAAGAAGGAIIGSVFSGAGRGAKAGGLAGLAAGTILGAVQGVAANHARYQDIYRACLAARGYTTGG
jgi:hypothetical protein